MSTHPHAEPVGAPREQLLPNRTSLARFAILGAAAGIILWIAGEFLLLVFAGILISVALRGAADFIHDRTGLPCGPSLAIVVLALVALLGGGGYMIASDIIEQFQQIGQQVRKVLEDIFERISETSWGQSAMEEGADAGSIAKMVGRTAFSVIGAFTTIAAVFVVAIFLAATGKIYRDGLLRLFPVSRRSRVAQILSSTAHTLRWWFLGQLVSMATLGGLTAIGLWLIGIPMWPALALLTAFLTFVPYLGAVLSAVPILLVSFAQSMDAGLYSLALYLTIQAIETNVVMPLVQQRAVSLPAAVALFGQILAGILFGTVGFILATPLAAAALVIVRMAYVEDVLGDDLDKPALRPVP